MIIKSATIFCLIALTHSAIINRREIPVEIRYDGDIATGIEIHNSEDAASNDISKSSDSNVVVDPKPAPAEIQVNADPIMQAATSNQIDDKPQESITPFKKLPEDIKLPEEPQNIEAEPMLEEKPKEEQPKPAEAKPSEPQLDEKVKNETPEEQPAQLLSDSFPAEMLPQEGTEEKNSIMLEKVEENMPQQAASQEQTQKEPEMQEEKMEQEKKASSEPSGPMLRGNLIDVRIEEAAVAEKTANEEPEPIKEPSSTEKESILKQAYEIVSNGLKQIKESLVSKGGLKPDQFENLEKNINDYFTEEKRKLQTKQDQPSNQNFIQAIANNFQNMANNFIQNFQGSSSGNSSQSDEGQNPLQVVQNGISTGT